MEFLKPQMVEVEFISNLEIEENSQDESDNLSDKEEKK